MSIAIQIGQIMFPLVVIVSVGFIVGHRRPPQLESINEINLSIFIPALVFSSLYQQQFDFNSYGILGFSGFILVLLTALIAIPLCKLLALEYKTIAPTMMFHNAGNVGLPLTTLALGQEGLAAALILFLVGNITHFGLGSYMLDEHAKWLRSLTSPAIVAAVLALIFQVLQVHIQDFILLPISMLGSIAVPLMLFALGVQLSRADFTHWKLGVKIGVLTPALGFSLAWVISLLVPLSATQTGALLLFGALPPAVMNFLFAVRYQQEPTKVSAIVLFGNVIAVIALPLALLYVLPRFT